MVEAHTHGEATRQSIPTAEFESVLSDDTKAPIQVAYERRNRDLNPHYLLADSTAGQQKEVEINSTAPSTQPTGMSVEAHRAVPIIRPSWSILHVDSVLTPSGESMSTARIISVAQLTAATKRLLSDDVEIEGGV